MNTETTEEKPEVVITAGEIAAQIKGGSSYEPPPAQVPESPDDDISDEELEKQVKDYEEGKGELPKSRKAFERVMKLQEKRQAELEKKFAAQIAEQEKRLKEVGHASLVQKKINLSNAYKARFVDEPEKAEKDFTTAEEYRNYIKERDTYKAAFEEAMQKLDMDIETGKAAAAEAAKGGSEFRFKSEEERVRFVQQSELYLKAVPEFAEIGKRWTELPAATLEAITASPMAPALLHAAIAEGFAKLPESEQVKAVYVLEHQLATALQQQQPPASAVQPSAPPLPPAPPKMGGKGTAPKADVTTAQDIIRQRQAGIK
ncbi:MAG: hypothetical protein LBU89_10945 [Fibromonadaceae bacterium]|jgi:exonuclease VII small subunit|nr:hypothetical protein [Fibromonadaceae bacterium]